MNSEVYSLTLIRLLAVVHQAVMTRCTGWRGVREPELELRASLAPHDETCSRCAIRLFRDDCTLAMTSSTDHGDIITETEQMNNVQCGEMKWGES